MMVDQKMKKRRKHGTKNAPEKKPKMTKIFEDQDSNAEVNYLESDVLRKLNDEILIVDGAGNIYFGEFENPAVEFCHETTVGEPPIVAEDVMTKIREDQGSNAEVTYLESDVLRKLNGEILIVDEAGNIYFGEFENPAVEFCHETIVGEPHIVAEDVMYVAVGEPPMVTEDVMYVAVGEPPIVAEDVMYAAESGTIYGSLVEYPAEVGLEIVKKNEENEKQSGNIFYVNEVGTIFLSMNTNMEFIESDIVLPVEMFDDEQRHENYDSDLEAEMKIRRLKEEICSLEERVKYIESLEEHVD